MKRGLSLALVLLGAAVTAYGAKVSPNRVLAVIGVLLWGAALYLYLRDRRVEIPRHWGLGMLVGIFFFQYHERILPLDPFISGGGYFLFLSAFGLWLLLKE
ncbi:MAG: hypothetical protein Q4E76_04690 [Tissierellia bacterium]|nr:hypothetical protein [Tissierellia bacterium]